MHCEVPSVGAQALFQLDMPAPKPNISIVSIKVALVQTVRVYTASGNVLSRTSEKQVARCFNAMPVTSGDLAGAKSAYVPRWKEGEPVSVVNNVLLPTHEVRRVDFTVFLANTDTLGTLFRHLHQAQTLSNCRPASSRS